MYTTHMIRTGEVSSRGGWLVGILLCFIAGVSLGTRGAEVTIFTRGMGTAQVELRGLVLSGTVTGKIEQTGSITYPDRRIDFTGTGDCFGTGYHDPLSFTGEAWVAYHVTGTTATGELIALRGLLYLLRVSEPLLRVGDVLEGAHYAVVEINGGEERFLGTYVGSLTQGSLVLPEPGFFLALGGEAVVESFGVTTPGDEEVSSVIPLFSTRWSPIFAEYVGDLFQWTP